MAKSKRVNPKRIPMRTLLAHVATILETPRDRLGRLDRGAAAGQQFTDIVISAEVIRELAVSNHLTPSQDTLEQIAKVIRVHLGE